MGGKQSKRTHKDLGTEKDIKLISEWFSTHNPFSKVNICVIVVQISL